MHTVTKTSHKDTCTNGRDRATCRRCSYTVTKEQEYIRMSMQSFVCDPAKELSGKASMERIRVPSTDRVFMPRTECTRSLEMRLHPRCILDIGMPDVECHLQMSLLQAVGVGEECTVYKYYQDCLWTVLVCYSFRSCIFLGRTGLVH